MGTGFAPYTPVAAPFYNRAGPELVKYHPLAEGILGFPYDLEAQPQEFYSYVDAGDRLIFARRAGFWKRFLAVLLDLVFLLIPLLFLTYADYVFYDHGNTGALKISSRSTPNPDAATPLSYVFLVLVMGYFFLTGVLWGGQSIGKRVLKLRVMRLDGQKPDWLTGAVRYLAGYLLSSNFLAVALVALIAVGLGFDLTASGFFGIIFFGWGFWWIGRDGLKQGWHDKLARTLVVDTREYVEGINFFRGPEG
jgi:uncharacterized RDD family membrane protein YckC